ncbi:carboxymethylenebutenolidase [Tistlia consotensis]|uniref:Carboxymethylenebutenolidase n=1 Tax=Tistlia consotensis USBA 355 TaxID=560819 RepID=A0A1Y6BYD5_9PROT|nr:dienelactone hydrolase family protein [Tistlia consotensis]SMF35947.1 carboxymethylenebutenolidase [Tistlia consotensis USBA 355]SNR71142.1 carboxymethylenebutenolidase [Tistlia consotensis]
MGEKVRIERSDGTAFGGWLSEPAGQARGNVVLLQEIFGVNHQMRGLCETYAAEGYRALAPALFDRVEPDVDLGYEPDDRAKGIALMQALAQDDVVADIGAALAALPAAPTAVIGFCWGGRLAWASAGKLGDRLACAVGYYGGGIAKQLDLKPRCPVQLHFGETDQSIPLSDVEAIRAAYPELELHVYPGGGHGFANAERSSFHRESSDLAFERTLAFLAGHL